jgi:hypothetical protein
VDTSLKQPTSKLVQKYVRKFDDPNSQTGQTDLALGALFATFPENSALRHVLLKVAALNSLYATNIFAVFQVAKHIHSLEIDPRLTAQDRTLVEDIAWVHISANKKRRNYSFATKYCSWHCPEVYPIYDSLVDGLLWRYAVETSFFDMERVGRSDFWVDYPTFVHILSAFKDYYSLQDVPIRQIDKFLWLYARELSGLPV